MRDGLDSADPFAEGAGLQLDAPTVPGAITDDPGLGQPPTRVRLATELASDPGSNGAALGGPGAAVGSLPPPPLPQMGRMQDLLGSLCSKRSFFAKPRNWFDAALFLVTAAALSTARVYRGVATWAFFPLVLRCFRFFRPFRSSEFGELRVIADNIFESLPMMSNVLVLTAIFYIGFAVIGVYSFGGSLQDYCVTSENLQAFPIIHCSLESEFAWGRDCPSGMSCQRTGVRLPDGQDASGDPYGGYLSYNNLGTALTGLVRSSSLMLMCPNEIEDENLDVDTELAEDLRHTKWNRLQPKVKSTNTAKRKRVRNGFSTLVPELTAAESLAAGFIKLEHVHDFLQSLGPPLSQTHESKDLSHQSYKLVYAELEEMCISFQGHLNFWHVLEVLIVNRLGFDALPQTKETPDRETYLARIYRVIHRQLAAEKIQSALIGRRIRQNLKAVLAQSLDRQPTRAEIAVVKNIRLLMADKARASFIKSQKRPSKRDSCDHRYRRYSSDSSSLQTVWRSGIESCIKRSNTVRVADGNEHLLTTLGPTICVSHPIVLMKAYTLTTEIHAFDVNKLQMCLERILDATKHNSTLKHDLAELIIRLLHSQGLDEPHILDIRAILTKVCTQIVQYRG